MGLPLRAWRWAPGGASAPFFPPLCLRKASSNTVPACPASALASLSRDADPGRRHTGLPGLRQGWLGCPTDCSGLRTGQVLGTSMGRWLPPKPHCEPVVASWNLCTMCSGQPMTSGRVRPGALDSGPYCAVQPGNSPLQRAERLRLGSIDSACSALTGLAPLGGPPRCSAGLRAPAAPFAPLPPVTIPGNCPCPRLAPLSPPPHPCPGYCPSQLQPGSSSWPTAHVTPFLWSWLHPGQGSARSTAGSQYCCSERPFSWWQELSVTVLCV